MRRSRRYFDLEAMVVLPDHPHCIWSLPEGDADFATRWRLIKTWFIKYYDPALRTVPSQNPCMNSGKAQPPLWLDYRLHPFQPYKARSVTSAREWPYSSIHRYIEARLYPPDWGQSVMDLDGVGHE